MKKNNKGFTLIELLAVIVILGIILTIATTNVIKNINDSKDKAKYIAAKEIAEMGMTYMNIDCSDCKNENGILESNKCVQIKDFKDSYLESDVTNPKDGSNTWGTSDWEEQKVCYDPSLEEQSSYKLNGNCYEFDDYKYCFN